MGLRFGVDWYPEQWDRSLWESDADRMKAFGVSTVRMMEFAWALVEPEPGRYDFSLFDQAIRVLADRGISVILGTPTATLPAWLAGDPSGVLQTHPSGRVRDFGARREGCWNAPAYREASRRLVREIAGRYGKRPEVEGFQIDNELGHEGSDRCVCPHCAREWRAWLKKRYGDVRSMNEAWGSVFWGRTVSEFSQVPVPRVQPATRHNPALLLDYDRFLSDTAAAFASEQTELLRAASTPETWITTNLFPLPFSLSLDMEDVTKNMDFASWDNYPVWGEDEEPLPYYFQSFLMSYVRGLKTDRPFTVMEQMSGIQAHVCLGHLPPEKRVALWTNQAIARGAERIVYFRWRTAAFAQEQLCYGLLDTDDRETERMRVLGANLAEAGKAFSGFASEPFESPVCLVYSKDDARLLREQYLSLGLYLKNNDWMQAGLDVELARWFAPYLVFNVNADVKSVRSVDLDRYKLISLPLYQMADPTFVERLAAWVDRGGVLVLSYRSGARDLSNRNVSEPLPGLFRALAGVRVPRFEALGRTKARMRVGNLPVPARGEVWADILEPETAKPVAFWSDRKKFYRGEPCVTVNSLGRGKVWYIGTSPDPAATFLLYRRILKSAGLAPRFAGMNVEIVDRRCSDGTEVSVILNHSPKRRRVLGRTVEPWGWAVVPRRG